VVIPFSPGIRDYLPKKALFAIEHWKRKSHRHKSTPRQVKKKYDEPRTEHTGVGVSMVEGAKWANTMARAAKCQDLG